MKKVYSVKEIADLLEVAKPTIQRAIIAEGIEPTIEKTQKRYYDLEKTARIIEKVAPGFDISALLPVEHTETATETPTKTDTNQPEQTEKRQQEPDKTAIEVLKTAMEVLREELEAKNRQIEALQGVIQGQTEVIKGMTENIKAAQALAAGDKQLLFESRTAPEAPETVPGEFVVASDPVPDDPKGQEVAAAAADQTERSQANGFFSRLLGKRKRK